MMHGDFTFAVRHRAAPQGSKTLDKGAKGKPFMREASSGVHPFRTAVKRAALGDEGRPMARFVGPVVVDIVFEFILENKSGKVAFNAMRRRASDHPMEEVGSRLRSLMPWLKDNRLVDRSKN